jgi:methionine biosynthesis protein MetW
MRPDQKIFFEYIQPNSKVIDVGCGEGVYLERLKKQKNIKAFGIEIESEKVATAVAKGISVIQGDGDFDLKFYPSKEAASQNNSGKGFDYSILAESLQVMKHPRDVLEECKRISTQVLVSIPNFGYIKNRLQLGFLGIMPVTKELSFEWYETPNIHFSTIKDFIALIDDIGFKIQHSYAQMPNGSVRKFNPKKPFLVNAFAVKGIFVLE